MKYVNVHFFKGANAPVNLTINIYFNLKKAVTLENPPRIPHGFPDFGFDKKDHNII